MVSSVLSILDMASATEIVLMGRAWGSDPGP